MARFSSIVATWVALIIGFTVACLAEQLKNFDFSRYERIDIDDYIRTEALSRDSRDRESEGFELYTALAPVSFEATLEIPPVRWRHPGLEFAKKAFLRNLPPVNYGLLLRTPKNLLMMVHVQDVIAESILREIRSETQRKRPGPVGHQIRIWAVYAYHHDGQHGFIVTYADTSSR